MSPHICPNWNLAVRLEVLGIPPVQAVAVCRPIEPLISLKPHMWTHDKQDLVLVWWGIRVRGKFEVLKVLRGFSSHRLVFFFRCKLTVKSRAFGIRPDLERNTTHHISTEIAESVHKPPAKCIQYVPCATKFGRLDQNLVVASVIETLNVQTIQPLRLVFFLRV